MLSSFVRARPLNLRIRLFYCFGSLDCAERGTGAGEAATAAITQIVAGSDLTCHLNGRSSYDRRIGSCQLPDGSDLGGLMITGGHCSRYW